MTTSAEMSIALITVMQFVKFARYIFVYVAEDKCGGRQPRKSQNHYIIRSPYLKDA